MEKTLILDEDHLKSLVKILKNHFINLYKVLLEVDPKEGDIFQSQNHAYHEKLAGKEHSCQDVMRHIYIPKEERTFYQEELYEMMLDYNLRDIIPRLLDYLGKKFKSIKEGGKKDNLKWDNEAEKFVLMQVLNQGITYFFAQELKKKGTKDSAVESKQPLLIATPTSWTQKFPNIKLDFLSPETIGRFLQDGISLQETFIDNIDFLGGLFAEVIYFYHEGRFEAPPYQDPPVRNDRFLNFSLSQLDEKSTPRFYHLCKCLTGLPFEFNLKSNLLVQTSESFQLSYFKSDNGFQTPHIDSSFDKTNDTGKKVSIMFLFSDGLKNKLTLKIHKPDDTEHIKDVEVRRGNLVILKSRVYGYGFEDVSGGTFLLKYWINGPADPTKLGLQAFLLYL